MTINNKKRAILLLAGTALLIYLLWFFLRAVEIVAVHQRSNNYSAILVRNFPLSDKDKINWWLKNRAMIKEKYNVPYPDENGFFSVTVWLFGEGYKEDKQDDDQYCFNDMKVKKDVLKKRQFLSSVVAQGTRHILALTTGNIY